MFIRKLTSGCASSQIPSRTIAPAVRVSAVSLLCVISTGAAPGRSAIAQITPTLNGTNTQITEVSSSAETTQIDIEGGETSVNGKGLFHSFDQFNVESDQIVNFITGRKVENIFGQIIGGASTINGILQASGSDANLYLINPSGLLLGSNFQLQLSGSFTATTAGTIGFSGGRQLDLSSDPGGISYRQLLGNPTSFDFSNSTSFITLEGLSVAEGQAIASTDGRILNATSAELANGNTLITLVEDGTQIRVSQPNQILSIEFPDVGSVANPLAVSQLITGVGSAKAASEINVGQDGTVYLTGDTTADFTNDPDPAPVAKVTVNDDTNNVSIDVAVEVDVAVGVGAIAQLEISESEPVQQEIVDIETAASEVLNPKPLAEPTTPALIEAISEPTDKLNSQQTILPISPSILEGALGEGAFGDVNIVFAGTETDVAIADTVNQIETVAAAQFTHYLGIDEQPGTASAASLQEMQDTLKAIRHSSSVRPALLYTHFASVDAESNAAGMAPPSPNDYLEIILVTPDGRPVQYRHYNVTRAEVAQVAADFRREVTRQFSRPADYLPPAQQLYNWFIQPLEPHLSEAEINSLGLIMADGLRVIPLAALHDGNQFLVEKYSLGLIPAFGLTSFDVENKTPLGQVLAMGVSKFVDKPDLPAVDTELSFISEELSLGDAFVNTSFTFENLNAKVNSKRYGIVHLATHASFDSNNADSSYIQLWDQQLKLSDLQSLKLGASEIAMIVLSACSTAIGDRASEYGFASFALSAGSESAMASLWPVNDEGTLGFMTQFYEQLPSAVNQSEALRAAQLSLLNGNVGIDYGRLYDADDPELATIAELSNSGSWEFSHPYYWSAFSMIGNPW